MTKRTSFVAALWFGGCVAASATAQQSNVPPDPGNSARETPLGQTPDTAGMNAVEALRASTGILDAFDTGDDTMMSSPNAQALDRYVEIIRAEDPKNPWLYYLAGRMQAFAGRQGAAIEHLRRFVDTREGRNDWRARRILGDLYVGEYPQLAKTEYVAANRLKANEPSVLHGLSMSAYMLGKIAEATRLAHEAATADGRRTVGHLRHLAQMLSVQRRWTESLQVAEQALRVAQNAARRREGQRPPLQVIDTQYALLIDLRQARLAEAPESIDDRLQLANDFRARADNARILALHDALDVLAEGVQETAPDPPAALRTQYATVLAEVGRRDQAIAEFERLLAADPVNAVATEWLDRLRSE